MQRVADIIVRRMAEPPRPELTRLERCLRVIGFLSLCFLVRVNRYALRGLPDTDIQRATALRVTPVSSECTGRAVFLCIAEILVRTWPTE